MKRPLNNEKNRQIKGKITKSFITFSENKPNLKNIKISVSSFETSKYEILSAWRSKKQTQYKPNSNPIYGMAKFALSSFITSKYKRLGTLPDKKQTQNKPNFILDVSSLGFLSGDKPIFILECRCRGTNFKPGTGRQPPTASNPTRSLLKIYPKNASFINKLLIYTRFLIDNSIVLFTRYKD